MFLGSIPRLLPNPSLSVRGKLADAGYTFADSRKHTVIYYQSARSLMPRHPAKEIKTRTVRGILKKLGIKEL